MYCSTAFSNYTIRDETYLGLDFFQGDPVVDVSHCCSLAGFYEALLDQSLVNQLHLVWFYTLEIKLTYRTRAPLPSHPGPFVP